MSCILVRHVSHTNESCLTYKRVMSRIQMSHVSHTNESCLTYELVLSHTWTRHVTQGFRHVDTMISMLTLSAAPSRSLRDMPRHTHAVCCSVLQCVAVCCSVLQCAAVCCNTPRVPCVTCRVIRMQCVAVCCSVSQCFAVCCSVLQHTSRGASYSSSFLHVVHITQGRRGRGARRRHTHHHVYRSLIPWIHGYNLPPLPQPHGSTHPPLTSTVRLYILEEDEEGGGREGRGSLQEEHCGQEGHEAEVGQVLWIMCHGRTRCRKLCAERQCPPLCPRGGMCVECAMIVHGQCRMQRRPFCTCVDPLTIYTQMSPHYIYTNVCSRHALRTQTFTQTQYSCQFSILTRFLF